jgi:hypothetical protein
MAEEKVAKTRSPSARKVTDVEAAPEEAQVAHLNEPPPEPAELAVQSVGNG